MMKRKSRSIIMSSNAAWPGIAVARGRDQGV
jgi:hypothetical protein